MTSFPFLTLFFLQVPAGILLHLLLIPWDPAWRGIFRTCAAVAAALLLVRSTLVPWIPGPALGAANLLAFAGFVGAVLFAFAAARGAPAALRVPTHLLAVLATGAAVFLSARAALPASSRPGALPLVPWAADAIGPVALLSAAVLGCALVAMLLGHFYLIAPTLPIRPLVVLSVALIVEVHLRLLASGAALLAERARFFPAGGWDSLDFVVSLGVFVFPRAIVGLLFPAVFSWLVWRTARIRSTQSATGILYVIVVFLIIGEMMSSGAVAVVGVPL